MENAAGDLDRAVEILLQKHQEKQINKAAKVVAHASRRMRPKRVAPVAAVDSAAVVAAATGTSSGGGGGSAQQAVDLSCEPAYSGWPATTTGTVNAGGGGHGGGGGSSGGVKRPASEAVQPQVKQARGTRAKLDALEWKLAAREGPTSSGAMPQHVLLEQVQPQQTMRHCHSASICEPARKYCNSDHLAAFPLRERFEKAGVLAKGLWEQAGTIFVGDRIPASAWPCTVPKIIELDELAGVCSSQGQDFLLWDEVRKQGALEQPLPVIIRSNRIQERHAVAASGQSTAAGDDDDAWTQRFVGKGRKLFVMFPHEDREKLLILGAISDYIDPINPPADHNHSCWGARCVFADVCAGNGDTLILPAGWMHFVLTIQDAAMICIELTVESQLLASLQTLQTIQKLEKWSSHDQFYSRWQEKGFCLSSMLKEFIEHCHCSRGGERERRKAAANGICAILDSEGFAKVSALALLPLCAWLRSFADETPSLASLPTLADRRLRDQPQWDDVASETLYRYTKALDVGLQTDNRGQTVGNGPLHGGDVRSKAREFLVDQGPHDPRIVFIEGFCHEQLATAFDVEKCGAHHGETSLLLSEAGATTHTHFDTGPYSAITFHLLADPGCSQIATRLSQQPEESAMVERIIEETQPEEHAFYEFVVITESCVLAEIGPDWTVRRICELYETNQIRLSSTGAAFKQDPSEIFIAQNNYSEHTCRIAVVNEHTFELEKHHPIAGAFIAEGLALNRESQLYVAGHRLNEFEHGVFEFNLSNGGCEFIRSFSTGTLNPWGVFYCPLRKGIFVTVDKADLNEKQLRCDASAAMNHIPSTDSNNGQRQMTKASGELWFQRVDDQTGSWKLQSMITEHSKHFFGIHMWRPGGVTCDVTSSTVFVTTYGDCVAAIDTTPLETHKVIVREGLHNSPALMCPNDVTIVGSDHLLVTAGNRDGSKGSVEVYHRITGSDDFEHVKTILFPDDDGIPNYIAGPLKLQVFEQNVEAACNPQFLSDFQYISKSQFMSNNMHNSAPRIPIHHRLRIYDTGDVRGKGVRYVGAQILAANTLICCYAGELLTPAQAKKLDSLASAPSTMGYMFDLKQFDVDVVQKHCGRCRKPTIDGVDIICDVCERCFHPACQGIADSLAYPSWSCKECTGFMIAQYNGDMSKTQQYEHHVRQHMISIVDAKRKGNVGRFMNHSCDPNVVVSKNVETLTLLMTTRKHIEPGDELTIDYHPGARSEERPNGAPDCICGSSKCRNWCPV